MVSFVPLDGTATFRAASPPREGVVDFQDDRRTVSLPIRAALPVLTKALTRFRADWHWDGSPALLQSRCVDETGYVQPSMAQLREVRGTHSPYHNNGIQTWQVDAEGKVHNVQV